MLESTIEHRLVEGIKRLGGLCYKFVSPGRQGVPDRIVIMPGGRIDFVELKTDTGRLSRLQQNELEKLRRYSCHTHVLYGMEGVQTFLTYMEELMRYGQQD